MNTDYVDMAPYTTFQTPSRRPRGIAVPHLDMGMVTSHQSQGLMTPISAGYDNLDIHISDDSFQSCYPESSHLEESAVYFPFQHLSIMGDSDIDRTPTSSLFSSSYLDVATASTSFDDNPPVPGSHQALIDSHNQCIVPLHTLSNPMQDMSLYVSHDWNNDSLTETDCSTNYNYSSPAQLLSPISTTSDEVHFKMDPYLSESPEIKPLVSQSFTKVKAPGRRAKKDTKRRNAHRTFKRRTDSGSVIEYSVNEPALKVLRGSVGSTSTKYYDCTYTDCTRRFARSEHQKRHIKTHCTDRNFRCYVEGCKAGKDKSGSFNRNDNANDHAYTHLKAWLGSGEGSIKVAELWGVPPRRSKARNIPMGPRELRKRIRARHEYDPEKAQKCFDTFNRKASDDFGIHFEFRKADCRMDRCLRNRGGECRICHEVRRRSSS